MGVCNSTRNKLNDESMTAPSQILPKQPQLPIASNQTTHTSSSIKTWSDVACSQPHSTTPVPTESGTDSGYGRDCVTTSRSSRCISLGKRSQSSWTERDAFPEPNVTMAEPMLLHDNQAFLILPQTLLSNVDFKPTANNIYQYNTNSHKYSVLCQYPSDFPKGLHTSAFCPMRQTLYIFTVEGYVLSYNLPSAAWKWEIVNDAAIFTMPALSKHDSRLAYNNAFTEKTGAMVIDDELHVVTKKQHITWRRCDKAIGLQGTFEQENHGHLVRIRRGCKDEQLWLIGTARCLLPNEEKQNCVPSYQHIHTYSTRQRSWSRSLYSLPRGLSGFGCVVSGDQAYVLLFGGVCHTPFVHEDNTVWIVDTRSGRVEEADVKCPVRGEVYACCVKSGCDEKVVAGWMREVAGGMCFGKPVEDVVRMYYCVEIVHLFDEATGEHWSMSLDEILGEPPSVCC